MPKLSCNIPALLLKPNIHCRVRRSRDRRTGSGPAGAWDGPLQTSSSPSLCNIKAGYELNFVVLFWDGYT